jgi:hypothetical protein
MAKTNFPARHGRAGTPRIPALRKLRQEDLKFKASWALQKIPGQLEFYSKTLTQKEKHS